MQKSIKVVLVGDHYAVLRGRRVVRIVVRYHNSGWQMIALDGSRGGTFCPAPLETALAWALRFD